MAGNPADAGAHLREAIVLAAQIGHTLILGELIERCGHLYTATGRWTDAVTLWAAYAADLKRRGQPGAPVNDACRAESMRQIEQEMKPGQLREAQERGARMTLSAAAELAIIATTAFQEESHQAASGKLLSPRERELVTLVAQGRTNAEIAAQLHISVRTVASHLDRIRGKTGYRRRADLTRLAVEEGLV
jgi:DNA-binding CsgD family transcriptional regulator